MQGLNAYPVWADNFGSMNVYYNSTLDPKMAEYDLITNSSLRADWISYNKGVLVCAEGQIYDQMIIQEEDCKGNVWTIRSDYNFSYVVDGMIHIFELTMFLSAIFKDGIEVDNVEDFANFLEIVSFEAFAGDEWETEVDEEVIA